MPSILTDWLQCFSGCCSFHIHQPRIGTFLVFFYERYANDHCSTYKPERPQTTMRSPFLMLKLMFFSNVKITVPFYYIVKLD